MCNLYEYISSKQIFISGLVNKMFYIENTEKSLRR